MDINIGNVNKKQVLQYEIGDNFYILCNVVDRCNEPIIDYYIGNHQYGTIYYAFTRNSIDFKKLTYKNLKNNFEKTIAKSINNSTSELIVRLKEWYYDVLKKDSPCDVNYFITELFNNHCLNNTYKTDDYKALNIYYWPIKITNFNERVKSHEIDGHIIANVYEKFGKVWVNFYNIDSKKRYISLYYGIKLENINLKDLNKDDTFEIINEIFDNNIFLDIEDIKEDILLKHKEMHSFVLKYERSNNEFGFREITIKKYRKYCR